MELPLTGRTIPVIADEYVDKGIRPGCVKITPAHDFNDYAVWQRHKDAPAFKSQPLNGLINIFDKTAAIHSKNLDTKGQTIDETVELTHDAILARELIPNQYRGLDRYAARKQIVADLEAAGLLAKTEPHKLMVPRGDRTHAVLEPLLTDQWYVKSRPARGRGDKGRRGRAHPVCARELDQDLLRMDAQIFRTGASHARSGGVTVFRRGTTKTALPMSGAARRTCARSTSSEQASP